MKRNFRIMAAILTICGASVFTACNVDNSDNPATNSLVEKIQGKWTAVW